MTRMSAGTDPYISWRRPLSGPQLHRGDTALISIDMAYDDTLWEAGRKAGIDAYFRERLKVVIPNIGLLQDAFRRSGMDVLHTRIASLTEDGRDRGPGHRELGYHRSLRSHDAQIIDELKPAEGEIVFTKTCSSVFNCTNIDTVLRNMGIRTLVFAGTVTTGCVETAVRDAADIGYVCVLVEDGCAAHVEEMQAASVRALRGVYARVKTTKQVLELIAAGT